MVRVRILIPFLGPFFRARSFLRSPLRFISRRIFRFGIRLGILGISIGLGGLRLSIKLGIFRISFGGGGNKTHVRHRGDDRLVKLPFKTLLNDLHVQHAQKATSKTKAEGL